MSQWLKWHVTLLGITLLVSFTHQGRDKTAAVFQIFLIENAWFSIKISLKFVPRGPVNNISALAWHQPGNKLLSEPMMVSLLMHIHVTRSQWVKQCTLTHWGRDKMYATTFLSAFSWMKMFQFQLKFHRSLFLRVQLTIFHHWFR